MVKNVWNCFRGSHFTEFPFEVEAQTKTCRWSWLDADGHVCGSVLLGYVLDKHCKYPIIYLAPYCDKYANTNIITEMTEWRAFSLGYCSHEKWACCACCHRTHHTHTFTVHIFWNGPSCLCSFTVLQVLWIRLPEKRASLWGERPKWRVCAFSCAPRSKSLRADLCSGI